MAIETTFTFLWLGRSLRFLVGWALGAGFQFPLIEVIFAARTEAPGESRQRVPETMAIKLIADAIRPESKLNVSIKVPELIFHD